MDAATGKTVTPFAIDIRVRAINDLFDSLDPSPLVDRALDKTVEDYIVDCARDAPPEAPLKLILHLAQPGEADAGVAAVSICNYFRYLVGWQTRRIRALLRDGRQALAVGAVFLIVCIALGQSLQTLIGGTAGSLLREGLLIIGWVANWRPVEIFLYDWRPMRRQLRIYRQLSGVGVELRPAA